MREIARLLELYDVAAELADGHLRAKNGAAAYIFSGRPSEIEKLQGLKLALLIVDEAQDGSDLTAIASPCAGRRPHSLQRTCPPHAGIPGAHARDRSMVGSDRGQGRARLRPALAATCVATRTCRPTRSSGRSKAAKAELGRDQPGLSPALAGEDGPGQGQRPSRLQLRSGRQQLRRRAKADRRSDALARP